MRKNPHVRICGGLGSATQRIGHAVERYWRKMLSSRSRKGHISWDVFHRIMAKHPLTCDHADVARIGSCKHSLCCESVCDRAECGKSARSVQVGAGGG